MKIAAKTPSPPRLVPRIDWNGMPDHTAEAHRLRAEALASAFSRVWCLIWRRPGRPGRRPHPRATADRAGLA